VEASTHASVLLVVGSLVLFWVGMLGLLWRRSLVGMLVGVLFGWLSVLVAGIAAIGLQTEPAVAARGATFVLCAALVCALQVALGLAIVVSRIARRGTLDAQGAGLLEG
jgi:NADH:ubiquinone oxidoreductase subunit K